MLQPSCQTNTRIYPQTHNHNHKNVVLRQKQMQDEVFPAAQRLISVGPTTLGFNNLTHMSRGSPACSRPARGPGFGSGGQFFQQITQADSRVCVLQ